MIRSRSAGRFALAAALAAASCAPPAESGPTSTAETTAVRSQAATSVGSPGTSLPTHARRSALVGDRAITLLPYVWRNFEPGDFVSGVYFSGTIRSADGSVPDGLTVLRFWVVLDAEVWTDVPAEVRTWTHRQTGVASFEAYASGGPAWAPDKVVRAIVRASYLGQTFDLDADPISIQSRS